MVNREALAITVFDDPVYEAMRLITHVLMTLDPIDRVRVVQWQLGVSEYKLGQATRTLVWALAMCLCWNASSSLRSK